MRRPLSWRPSFRPGDALRRQAHRIAPVRAAEHAHGQRGVGDGARQRSGHAAGERRLDGNAAQTGLEAHHAAPARRQSDRATDVGAHVQRAIARRRRSGGTGAGAARVFRQIPGVARQPVEAGQTRRQHAPVRHGGLRHKHRASLAQPRSRWRVRFGRREQRGRAAQRRGHPPGGDVLLQRHRHAVQQAQRFTGPPARFRGPGHRPRLPRVQAQVAARCGSQVLMCASTALVTSSGESSPLRYSGASCAAVNSFNRVKACAFLRPLHARARWSLCGACPNEHSGQQNPCCPLRGGVSTREAARAARPA